MAEPDPLLALEGALSTACAAMAKLVSSSGEGEREIEWKMGPEALQYPVDLCQALDTLNNALEPMVGVRSIRRYGAYSGSAYWQ
ncbi:hypothetical protein KIPB_015022, partial [Kipferlia bialata]|eukprot:g15022.t1